MIGPIPADKTQEAAALLGLSQLTTWLDSLTNSGVMNIDEATLEYLCRVNRIQLKQDLDGLAVLRTTPAQGKAAIGERSRQVGKAYESLIQRLIEKSISLKYEKNIQTDSNEIDFLIAVQSVGTFIPLLKVAGAFIIGEAKCHAEAPNSTLSNALFGLMSNHGTKVAILFVGCSSRVLHHKVRNAISMHKQKDVFIVPFGLAQFDEVVKGMSFLGVLGTQYRRVLSNDTKLAV